MVLCEGGKGGWGGGKGGGVIEKTQDVCIQVIRILQSFTSFPLLSSLFYDVIIGSDVNAHSFAFGWAKTIWASNSLIGACKNLFAFGSSLIYSESTDMPKFKSCPLLAVIGLKVPLEWGFRYHRVLHIRILVYVRISKRQPLFVRFPSTWTNLVSR